MVDPLNGGPESVKLRPDDLHYYYYYYYYYYYFRPTDVSQYMEGWTDEWTGYDWIVVSVACNDLYVPN